MSVRGFNTRSGIEQYDYDYLDNKPDAPTKDSIGLGNVDNTSDMGKPVSTAQEQALSQKVDKVPGMGLSQEDYTSAEKEKLGDLPTNEELEADLAGKASAEIVAALESAVNDPDNGLETKASAIINTASGAIASFSDGADGMPVKKLVVNVEPQQDLHGYDNPWPEGGGKNLIKNNGQSQTINGVTFTVNSDGSITAKGTATAGITFPIWGRSSSESRLIDLKADEKYTVSGTNVQLNGITAKSGIDVATTFTAQSGDYISFVWIYITNGTVVDKTYYPQLELGTATSYAPYSNICPISGWTGAEIDGAGKNLLNINEYGGRNSYNIYGIPNTLHPNTQYTWSVNGNTSYKYSLWIGTSASAATTGSQLCGYVASGEHIIFTTPAEMTQWLLIGGDMSGAGTADFDSILGQLELGSTATPYEPFQSKEISVTFPTSAGTVYGATLTVNPDRTGTLVVDRAMVDGGTLLWNYSGDSSNHRFSAIMPADYKIPLTASERASIICSAYASNPGVVAANDQLGISGYQNSGVVYIRDLAYSDYLVFRSAMSGVQLVYERATPITYTLTESEISGILTTIYGTNNIWADCGDSTVEYTCDTRLFIEQLTQPTEDDMTADHAISAGTFFMIGNNLYLATSQIAAGATITPGTNATKLSLADALNQLNA